MAYKKRKLCRKLPYNYDLSCLCHSQAATVAVAHLSSFAVLAFSSLYVIVSSAFATINDSFLSKPPEAKNMLSVLMHFFSPKQKTRKTGNYWLLLI